MPRRVSLNGELGLEEGNRVLPLAERFVDFARAEEREGVGRVELDRAPEIVEPFARLLQAFVPEAPELFVHRGELGANLRALRNERSEGLGAALEQRHEGFHVALLAIELGEAVGSRVLGRVALDRLHQDARGAVRIAEGRRPHVRGFAQPVRCVCGVLCLRSYTLEEQRIRLRIRCTGLMRGRERLFVVGIGDQTVDKRVNLTRIHAPVRLPPSSFCQQLRVGDDATPRLPGRRSAFFVVTRWDPIRLLNGIFPSWRISSVGARECRSRLPIARALARGHVDTVPNVGRGDVDDERRSPSRALVVVASGVIPNRVGNGIRAIAEPRRGFRQRERGAFRVVEVRRVASTPPPPSGARRSRRPS